MPCLNRRYWKFKSKRKGDVKDQLQKVDKIESERKVRDVDNSRSSECFSTIKSKTGWDWSFAQDISHLKRYVQFWGSL